MYLRAAILTPGSFTGLFSIGLERLFFVFYMGGVGRISCFCAMLLFVVRIEVCYDLFNLVPHFFNVIIGRGNGACAFAPSEFPKSDAGAL